jgi:hypothetical protein
MADDDFLGLYNQEVIISMGHILNGYRVTVFFNCSKHPPVHYASLNQMEQSPATRNFHYSQLTSSGDVAFMKTCLQHKSV